VDLSTATWEDVAFALHEEARLSRELEASDDAEGAQRQLNETRDSGPGAPWTSSRGRPPAEEAIDQANIQQCRRA